MPFSLRPYVVALLAAGAGAFVAALLWLLPASWMALGVERASGSVVQLRAPQGTVWRGGARLVAKRPTGGWSDLGQLRWTLRPWPVFTGRLVAEVAIGDAGRTFAVDLSPGVMVIRGLDLELPGELLAHLGRGLEALGPQGRVRLSAENLRLEAGAHAGEVQAQWRPAQLRRAQGIDLGSHVLRLRGAGDRFDIELDPDFPDEEPIDVGPLYIC